MLTEEGYTAIPHYLSTFSNELGLGTGNITSYGRMVYAVDLAKSAESLQRSIGMHLLLRPSDDPKAFQLQVKAFNSYNYLEFIALGEFDAGGTDADSQHAEGRHDAAGGQGRRASSRAPSRQADDGPHIGAAPAADGSIYNGMAAAIGGAQNARARRSRPQGITPESWMAAATSKFDGYTHGRERPGRPGRDRGRPDRGRRQDHRRTSTARSSWSPCSPPSSWPAWWPAR